MTPEEEEAHRAFVDRTNEEISDREEMQGWTCLAVVAVAGTVFVLSLFKIDVPMALAGFLLVGLPYVFATRLLWRARRPLDIGHGLRVTGRETKHLLIIALIVVLAQIAVQVLWPGLSDGW
jgi:hypothetical protein